MYKNQLQELAQRSCLNLPVYACIRQGPDHAPRFKATVNFNGEIFESPSFFRTLRQAEHAAAEIALNTLSKRGRSQSLAAGSLDETGVFKNLLQETAQRAGVSLPVYSTVRSGHGHLPVFTSTVTIAGMTFSGEPAKTKKQAEKSAARTAWSALKQSMMVASADSYLGCVRSFPHVEGKCALHVHIPVPLSSIIKRRLEPLIRKASVLVPELQSMNVPLYSQYLEGKRFPSPQGLKLSNEYHLSLSRTVPIRIHQIDSIVSMLRNKFYNQKRYWTEFVKWDAFINDEQTRSFLALEILYTGSSQICGQINAVNEVFRLHNIPTYYENPRPHISLAWTLGIASPSVKNAVEELNKWIETTVVSLKMPIFSYLFSKAVCKIGNRTYPIWEDSMQSKDAGN